MKKILFVQLIISFFTCIFFSTAFSRTVDSLLLQLEQNKSNYDQRAIILNELSYKLQFTDPKQGLAYADEVLAFQKNIKNPLLIYTAQREKANNLFQLGRFPEALTAAEEALKGFLKTSDKKEISLSYGTLGVIFNHMNNYPKALENLQNSLKLLEELGDPKTANTYLNIANIYGQQGQNDKAMSYLQLANEKAIEIDDKLVQTYCIYNMSNVELARENHASGLQLLDSALRLARKSQDKTLVSRIFGNKGKTFYQTQQYDSAIFYYHKAIQYSDSIHNERGKLVAMAGLGETYFQTGESSKSYTYSKTVYQKTKEMKMVDLQQRSAENLSNYFEKIGRSDSALFYFKQHIQLRDQIANEKNKNEITRLEMQYDFDLKEKDYLQQQELSKLKIKQLTLYGVLVILLLLGSGGILMYRHRIRGLQFKNKIREIELKAIRAQMNPHFIFNVLNSIEFYILEQNAKLASRIIQKFAKLTRLILENSTQSLISAHKEWQSVQLYAELESTRFQNQFDIEFELDTSLNLLEFELPPMMIQPLVENAIHHGVRNLTDRMGKITVRMERQSDQYISIRVCDNGVGLKSTKKNHDVPTYKEKSLGLQSIFERLDMLKLLYPKQSDIFLSIEELNQAESSGTCSHVVLPYLHATASPKELV